MSVAVKYARSREIHSAKKPSSNTANSGKNTAAVIHDPLATVFPTA